MKKTSWPWTVVLSAGCGLILVAGCATEPEESFNQNFNQDLPTSPKYAIRDISADHFKIDLHQGSPEAGSGRVTYLKQAATVVARDEARRRGWGDFRLDYIDERDQGWMHVVVADVHERPAVLMTPAAALPPTAQPAEPPPGSPPPGTPPPDPASPPPPVAPGP